MLEWLLVSAGILVLAWGGLRHFISDLTLYDRLMLPTEHPLYLRYMIESGHERVPFPSVFERAEVYMSLVVPAFNEERRLPPMMNATLEYLSQREGRHANFTWEIIVVDDGSRDGTCEVVRRYAEQYPQVRLMKQPKNGGKGAAIQAGSLHARGERILMVDADGASDIACLEDLERAMDTHTGTPERIAVGSRTEKGRRTVIRKLLGAGMHVLIWAAGVRGISDTQCGFKLFSREAARHLFTNQHVAYWCFDPELLMIGRQRKMHIDEVPIRWNEIGGSKMRVRSMVRMAIDLLRIAIYYRLRLWSVRVHGPPGPAAAEL